MKKALGFVLSVGMVLGLLSGCNSTSSSGVGSSAPAASTPVESVSPNSGPEASSGEFDATSPITVVSREDGSGTRGAFVELVGVVNDEEEDMTVMEAVTVQSTSVVMTTVAGDPYGIGYISLGSLNETVKALEIDGVAPSVETVKDGRYKIARPFNLAVGENVGEVAQDFIDFILSAEGQAVVEENGYISAADGAEAYAGTKPAGKVVVAGSSSITPVMEKLKEAYAAVNPNAEIEIQMSDSSTGMSSTIDGICDIGMASRELKDSELEAGLTPIVIAMDGIAVIVNNENPATAMSLDALKNIYLGETLTWDAVA
ncbi:substrate-binding domain-containing protein [Ruminococcaceae bacterium OttesenSCG-928-I18]|nr:substrate-binding domain-containing protein [Ruminococcaceae bacterium OttesenSCG-928-I18]